MKQANNNEVDLLLRSLARERKPPVWQDEEAAPAALAHLDADELNSYAEGVVPDAARARYTQHLADCDTCRGIVVDLTQTAGAANRFELEQTGGAGFWQRLSEFFSPKVLGFAIPALVLTAVVGISLLALKQRQEERFVAKNEPVATPLAVQENIDSKSSSAAQPQTTAQNKTQLEPTSELPKETNLTARDKLQEGQESIKQDSGAAKAPAKDSGQPVDTSAVTESRPYAPEPKAEAAPPPPLLDAEKSGELAKTRTAKREDQRRDEDEAIRVQTDDVHGPNRSRNNTAQPAAQRGAGIGTGGPSGMDKKKATEADTRTVMGRQFMREDGIWVDTAYQSSRATVRVSRGSDQYRALVADEPGLRTIAEQLNGVVIVVWKNRAYRIQ